MCWHWSPLCGTYSGAVMNPFCVTSCWDDTTRRGRRWPAWLHRSGSTAYFAHSLDWVCVCVCFSILRHTSGLTALLTSSPPPLPTATLFLSVFLCLAPSCCPKFYSGNNRMTFIIISFSLAVPLPLALLSRFCHPSILRRQFVHRHLLPWLPTPLCPLSHPSLYPSMRHFDSSLVRLCGGLRCRSICLGRLTEKMINSNLLD